MLMKKLKPQYVVVYVLFLSLKGRKKHTRFIRHCTVGSGLDLSVGLKPGVSAFICGTVKTVPYFFVLSQTLLL